MGLSAKAICLYISFLVFTIFCARGQDQKVADSLKTIYQHNILDDSAKLDLLSNLSFNEVNDLNLAIHYADELINLAGQLGNTGYVHNGYFLKGNKKRLLGDIQEALDSYIRSGEAARKAKSLAGEGITYGAIADIYSLSNNHNNARHYYQKAISTLRQTDDSIALASTISNAGDEYLNTHNYDSALLYFRESEAIFERVNYATGKAYSLGNIGMVYANIGQSELAEKNINEAMRLLEGSEDYYPICVYLISMAEIYFEKGDAFTAMNYATKSLNLAQKYGLKDQISDANLKLSELYDREGNPAEAFKFYKNHIAYRDSVNNIQSVQQMADLRTNYEVSQKQVEVDLLNQQKSNQRIMILASVITSLLVLLLATGLYRRYYFIKKTNVIIDSERSRAESLLLNILPEETAHELKAHGTVQAKKFESVTVLFTDFKEFTKSAEHVEPEQLVKSIDFYFREFDSIISKYGLEKIKTIGDAYMCAGGLPKVTKTHAKNVIQAAREIIQFVGGQAKIQDDLIHFEVRIGVHTGPVVAGIVGTKKWQYDIWGDTVNIASRMESMSEPGKVNLSETTYQHIKDEFPCEYRGQLDAKNRGALKMYFLS
jgi:adenylate cyclase